MENIGARPAGRMNEAPRVRVSSPAGLLAVVPHLLGFHPAQSVVVIGAGGPRDRVRFGCRYDLPDPPGRAAAARIAEHAVQVLSRESLTTVMVVGYGPGRLVTPVTDVLAAALPQAGLTIREMLRAEDGRYWSYLCTHPGCCPPEGVPFDVSSHPVAAAMTVAGLPAYPDRAALERSLAPVTGRAATEMSAAVGRAYDRAGALLAEGARTGRSSGRRGRGGSRAGQGGTFRLFLAEGKRAARETIAAYRSGSAVTDDQLAWLAVTLTDMRVRDDAWARMEPEHREAHLRLWADLVRRVEPALIPGPAALLAFVAWQSGNGALAGIAIDRALAADPAYSLALLLADVIAAGIPPSEAQLPMTPEEVEESYALAERGRPPGRSRAARVAAGSRRTPGPTGKAGPGTASGQRGGSGGEGLCGGAQPGEDGDGMS